MSTVNIFIIFLFAFLGGILNSLLGWAKQVPAEPFDVRKFITSFIPAVLGGAGVVAIFDFGGITNIWLAALGALLSGAGVTSAVGNVSGAIAARAVKKLSKSP
jgi:hypothetical protein